MHASILPHLGVCNLQFLYIHVYLYRLKHNYVIRAIRVLNRTWY